MKHEATLWQQISDGKGSEVLEMLRSQSEREPDAPEEPVRH